MNEKPWEPDTTTVPACGPVIVDWYKRTGPPPEDILYALANEKQRGDELLARVERLEGLLERASMYVPFCSIDNECEGCALTNEIRAALAEGGSK